LSALPKPISHQTLKAEFAKAKHALFAQVLDANASTRRVKGLLQKLSRLTDGLLRELWTSAHMPSRAALVAVGGYGRGELFPHSDVDVLLLLPPDAQPETDTELKEKIERFIGSCWDVGLEIGSSVRGVQACVQEAAKDITVQTSLLESRLVAGNKSKYRRFTAAFWAQMDAQAFFTAKTLEMRQRHTKYEDTPYSLEPNCKESPGGLRDLQVLLWVAKAARLGKSWDELARKGIITALEAKQLKANEALLGLVRARLHLVAKRREDRLVFDLQTAVAERFGHQATGAGASARKASEALMRRYYWAAKAVTQLNQIVLLGIAERLSPSTHGSEPINERFANKAGMLEVRSDDVYLQNPHAILETFLVYQTVWGVKGLSARTLRALYNARHVMDSRFRADPVNRATFLQILQQPEGITHAMRLMNQTSVLGRYLWVFRRIVGQMQHDLFHVYTVDQHILMVLRNVRRFFIAEHAHEYPFCSQLAAGWDKPWLLYVAALFHDIAKGRGGDHSELGGTEVRSFCRQHGIAKPDADLIEFLVREHLSMSRVAQKEDLSDPDVITAFTQRVGDERHLTALYLLTVADIRGTSPKVWNAWKGKLLEDLFRLTRRALGGGAPDADAEVEQRKREAVTKLALHAMPHEAHLVLWNTLDVGYFMRHDASDIAWHARMLSRHVPRRAANSEDGSPPPQSIVRARLSPVGEGLQVLVYTPDQADLFARICGYFEQAGFNILDAKIHTANNGYALDTFQVIAPTMQEHYRELITMVQNELERTIDEAGALPTPLRARVSRRVRSFPITPRVALRPDERGQRWFLSVSCSDRVGLLYAIARVLAKHRINLMAAKVLTLGERVEDSFVIDGPELANTKKQLEIETELLAALAA
jgi:[protein-PII] uridylyltransferase